MVSATDTIFQRLESAISEWSAEIKSASAGMTEKLARAKDRLGDAPEGAESVEALTASLDFARAEFARLEVALRECLSAAKTATERAGSASEATDSIREQQTALREEFSSLRVQLDEKFAAMADAVPAPPAHDEALVADLDTVKNQLQEVRERLETPSSGDTDETLADIRAELELLRGAVMELQDAEPTSPVDDDRAGALASELDALRSEMASLREWQQQASETAGPMPAGSNELAELRDDLSRLRGVMVETGDTEQRIEELEGLLAVERERSDRLEQRIAEAAQAEQPAGITNEVAVELDLLREDLAVLRAELAEVRVTPGPAASVETYIAPPPPAMPPPAKPEVHRATVVNLELSGFDSDGRRRRMGDILVDAGVLTQEQLEQALQEQQEHPQRRLGAILVELGYTDSEVIAQVLACQLKLPFVHLESDVPEEVAVRLVNGRLCRHHHCIPVRVEDETVILAMSNPLDLIAIEDIELATSRRVDPVVAAEPDIAKAIDWFCGSEG